MTDRLKRFGLADEIALCFKRSPFAVQKGSFCNAKRVLSENMRNQGAVNVYFFLSGGVFRLLKKR